MVLDLKAMKREVEERGGIIRLDNGPVIIYENIPGFGLVKGKITINAGAMHEDPKDLGVMHFLEHMAHNGTRRHPQREDLEISAGLLGLAYGAHTNRRQVVFPVEGRRGSGFLLQDRFVDAFSLEASMAFHPLLRREDIEKERKIIQDERRSGMERRRRNPLYEANNATRARNFSNNPLYLREVIGTEETIDGITVESLREYHKRFFVGSNTIVELVGDLNDGTDIISGVSRLLDELPTGEKAPYIKMVPERPFDGYKALVFEADNLDSVVASMFFPFDNPLGRYDISVMTHILGGPLRSLLSQELRQKQGIYHQGAYIDESHDSTGYICVTYTVSPEDLPSTKNSVHKAIDKLKKGDFDEGLLEAEKACYAPGVLAAFKEPGSVCSDYFARHTASLRGEEALAFDKITELLALTKDDIVHRANECFTDNYLTVMVGPRT